MRRGIGMTTFMQLWLRISATKPCHVSCKWDRNIHAVCNSKFQANWIRLVAPNFRTRHRCKGGLRTNKTSSTCAHSGTLGRKLKTMCQEHAATMDLCPEHNMK